MPRPSLPRACLQTSLACHSERSVVVGEGGDDTESKNPGASERTPSLHSTGFFDSVPARLRPLGTPLRMTADGSRSLQTRLNTHRGGATRRRVVEKDTAPGKSPSPRRRRTSSSTARTRPATASSRSITPRPLGSKAAPRSRPTATDRTAGMRVSLRPLAQLLAKAMDVAASLCRESVFDVPDLLEDRISDHETPGSFGSSRSVKTPS